MSGEKVFLCPKCNGIIGVYTRVCPYCVYDLSGFDYSRTSEAGPSSYQHETAQMDKYDIEEGFFQRNQVPIVIAVLTCLIVGVIGVLGLTFSLFPGSSSSQMMSSYSNNSAATYKNPNAAKMPLNTSSGSTSSSAVGRSGRLTTDLNIRKEPNKYAESIGIHYMNARVQVLEAQSYPVEDEVSTWYRVKVIEYGCSRDPSLGCGKNSSNDADQGWMNAKHILLD